MLDLTSAILLGGTLLMLVQLVKKAAGNASDGTPRLDGALVIVVCIVLALVTVFVTRESDFAASQIVDGRSLDHLNVFSCILVALQLAGITVLGATAFEAIKNIGENDRTQI